MAILEVRELSRHFGGLRALSSVSFAVESGEIRGLIGPNGAGKTTMFNVISGFYAPTSGQVFYDGRDVSGLKTSKIAELGLVRTFQHTTLFQELSVRENVLVGCHLHTRSGLLSGILGRDRETQAAAQAKAEDTLAFFDLADRADEPTANLPHGLQRALGMAVALAADPRVLLLDEPFTGMNPEETRHMMDLVLKARGERDITVLLVEHDMQAVMGICDSITVLNFGQLLVEGTPEAVRNDPQVIEAYLGSAAVEGTAHHAA